MISVPVLLYHHINRDDDVLSIPPELFEEHLRFLKDEGYVSILPEELCEFMITGRRNFRKAVVITFDDGYLDTWVYAYPLLKRYGFRAVLFLVTWTVEEDEFLGLNLEDYWKGRITADRLPVCESVYVDVDGYPVKTERRLCWAEVKEMERSGVFDVEPHSKRHRKVYSSNRVVGFNRPKRRNSAWCEVRGDSRYGTLDFDRSPELSSKEFIPDTELNNKLAEFVVEHGYLSFFERNGWEAELNRILENYIEEHGSIGRFESDEEMKARIRMELEVVKGEVSHELRKQCDSFAWPWGAYSDVSLSLAREVGFRYMFTTKAGSNAPGGSCLEIRRFKVWKKDLGWFRRRIRIYSNKLFADAYSKLHGKI